jgi:1,2-diacylglycerol 3-beta-galactosyltransferase
MSGTERSACVTVAQVPLLFLIADTGGGHRNAARAVSQALDHTYPGRFAPVLCDPLGGAGSARLLRWVVSLYGPAIRLAPWLWGAAYHACNSSPAMAVLARTLLRLAADAVAAHRPAAIVSFHPLTGLAAVSARDRGGHAVPVVTVVTDLVNVHAAWRCAGVDLMIAPLAARSGLDQPDDRLDDRHGGRWTPAGPPVTRDFWAGPPRPHERAVLRRSLGLSENRLNVLLTGGGEGSGGIGRRAAAILRRFADVDVVAICGRNLRLKRRLDRLAARYGNRLTVIGFASNMADWLRCADLIVTKAGPGTIAEAACCAAPLLLTSHLPGQEKGNTEFVAGAAAGCRVPGVRRLLTEIGRLRDDDAAMNAMRAASARLGRPRDTGAIAELIAGLVPARPVMPVGARPVTGLVSAAPLGPSRQNS